MGIGMLDSEESSSSALSAIALAVSTTSDENSNETTPCTNVARMAHQQTRLSLNSTASTLDNTIIEMFSEDTQERSLQQSAEKLHALAQAKRTALANSECSSNSNSPSKRTRNPLATVTCNNQIEPPAPQQLPPPPQQQQTPLSLLPSTSKQALRQKKPTQAPTAAQGAPQPPQTLTSRLAATEYFFVYRTPVMSAHISSGINYFEKLSDEILLDIFKWLPKKTLLRLATVCRRFNRCARDETLWTRLDLGLRTLRPTALEQVVKRGVPILRLAQAEVRN